MISEIDNFLTEIRSHPPFVKASHHAPIWNEHLDALESSLRVLYLKGDDNADLIVIYDKTRVAMKRTDLTLKERLLTVQSLLEAARDSLGIRQ